MRQELRETSTYNAIIAAVAMGNTKMNDIHQKTQIEKSKLSVYLRNLIDLSILNREFPVSDGVKEQANIQRGLYQVTDHFFRFWYAFVFPNLSELEAGDADGIWRYAVEPAINQFTSHVFEDVCRQYLRKENRIDALPFRFTKIGRWWYKTDELDVMATDQRKENFLLGECKFKNSPFDMSEFIRTQSKFKPKSSNSRMYYWLFSKSGFTEEVLRFAAEQGVRTVTVEEIVKQ